MKQLIADLEIKGYNGADLHWILFKNGFELFCRSPYGNEYDAPIIVRNREAIEKTRIEIRYLTPKFI